MKSFVCITNMESARTGMEKAAALLPSAAKRPRIWQMDETDHLTNAQENELAAAGFAVILWMGTGLSCQCLKEIHAFLTERSVPFYLQVADLEEGKEKGRLTGEETETVRDYLNAGGRKNWAELIRWALTAFCGGDLSFAPPEDMPYWGIYDPDLAEPVRDVKLYLDRYCDASKPTAGLLMSREDWFWGNLEWEEALIYALRKAGMNVICAFTTTGDFNHTGIPTLAENMKHFLYAGEKPAVDVLLNPFVFGLTTSGFLTLADLAALNVPVLQLYNTYRDYAWWDSHFAGLTPNEIAYAVAIPEFDGVIHSLPVSTLEEKEDGTHYRRPMKDRMADLAKRVKKWALLSRLPNAEKKIAIVFHNYPADNSHIGSASQLDSIESVRQLLIRLKESGYTVDRIPKDAQELIDELTAHVTNDRRFLSDEMMERAEGKLSGRDYRDFFDTLPEKTKLQMEKDWGEAPGDIFRVGDDLAVPGFMNGNIYITVQPPRGFGDDPGKIYHSPDMAPTHQYLGTYEWIRDVWRGNAMIHVGTHGNLEWLPGKGVAMSSACYPDINTGDMPDIYPYWITCVGEGIQAKRRAASCLISYLSAPMSLAGTYDEYEELETALEEYSHFKNDDEAAGYLDAVRQKIRDKAAACHLEEDVKEADCETFDDYIGKLHTFITDLKHMQISVGLHVLGKPPSGEDLTGYLYALTKVETGDKPSLAKTMAMVFGRDYYELLENSGATDEKTGMTFGELADTVVKRCEDILLYLQEIEFNAEKIDGIFSLPWANDCSDDGLAQTMKEAARFICETIAPSLMRTTDEIENTVAALSGNYTPPGPSGAPTSGGADLLPTGKNFFSIDPRVLPTETAWQIGCQMADQVIEAFIADEGRYPESVGIILWATSNMRNHGTCLAEFLYLMGLRPVWQKGTRRVIGLEVIPLSELKRPRVDVTGRISGLFRDALPASVTWLDEAAGIAAALDEPEDMNFVRKHVRQEAGELEDAGVEKEEAWRLASYRVFGDPPGCFGAGVGALLEAKNWQTVDDIAKVYTVWGGYAYGKGTNGTYRPAQFEKRMSQIEITVQNVDQRESSMLCSDDYNAYRGGMVAAVRSASGKMPKNYVSDSSDKSKVLLRSLETELKRWFRGEAVNPKYIEGMKKHGYKGAGDLAEYLAVSFQWDATSCIMEDWMYDEYARKYVLSPDMQDWMKQVNPWALERMVSTLLEAQRRGMWHADKEVAAELEELVLSIEGELEGAADGDD